VILSLSYNILFYGKRLFFRSTRSVFMIRPKRVFFNRILYFRKQNHEDMIRAYLLSVLVYMLFSCRPAERKDSALVLLTDFGTKDGAVAAMKGVALQVSGDLQVHDLTHEIPAFNIWEGAYRLDQTAPYWAAGTVFVCVVDPGVGTERKPVVLKTGKGHYFVGPDNGLFTLIAEREGIEEVREISKSNRLAGSDQSYTFHGRDVFAYTGAKLASGVMTFEETGEKLLAKSLLQLVYPKAVLSAGHITGGIPVLDIQYGNVWTNVNQELFNQLKVKPGQKIRVKISKDKKLVTELVMPYVHSFGGVAEGENLAYMNSLMNLSFGINMGDFSKTYGVFSGPDWQIDITAEGNSSGK